MCTQPRMAGASARGRLSQLSLICGNCLCVICGHLAGCSFRSTISRAVPPRARPPCIPDGLSRLATTGPIGMYKAHPWHPMPIDSALDAVHSALVLIPPAVESAILNSARPHAQQLNRCRFGRHGERPFLIPSKQRQHSSKTKKGWHSSPSRKLWLTVGFALPRDRIRKG